MLKILASWKFGIAIAVILCSSVYVSSQDQKTRDQYEQKCTQLNARSISPSAHSEDCDKGAENAARHLPRWYRIFGWPEGITTWAILLTLLALAEQTSQTKRAAIATEDAARAAQDSVNVMREQNKAAQQKQRARIVVKIIPAKLPITQVLWQVKFQVENIGPTHAFDAWLYVKFEFTASPVPPPIHQTKMLQHLPRIRAEKSRHVLTDPLVWEDVRNEARMQEVAAGKLFLHMRGTVDYQDIFGEPHVTPFRYLWNANIDTPSWGDLTPRWFEAVHGADPKAT